MNIFSAFEEKSAFFPIFGQFWPILANLSHHQEGAT